MKIRHSSQPGLHGRVLFYPLLTLAALLGASATSRAQIIYTAGPVGAYSLTTGAPVAGFTPISTANADLALSGNNLYVTTGNTLADYNATTGAAISSMVISGYSSVGSPVISGNNVYLDNGTNSGSVGEFSLSTGQPVAGFNGPSGTIGQPSGMALLGNTLYVVNWAGNSVDEYNATTGTFMESLITGLSNPRGLVLSGNDLYVSSIGTNTVGEYNATTGAAVPGFTSPTGLSGPFAIAVSPNGADLFVSNWSTETIGEYNASTGATIAGYNSPTGLDNPVSFVATPEPSAWLSLVGGLGMLVGFRRFSRKRAA